MSTTVFQTGSGGAIYLHGVFHSDVLMADVFTRLSPNGDDSWLYWMMRLNGSIARKVGVRHVIYTWPDTQRTALFHNNATNGGNDQQIGAMIKTYGFTYKV